jgi:hypothetical protein
MSGLPKRHHLKGGRSLTFYKNAVNIDGKTADSIGGFI